ncbi:putative transcription factor c2h2 protein [Botrytis fragariae]|uniref:Putative transcription factor c2h2 protein n=1 Tax=Botrytis fragariae TaxID=1964551 RepID=A0A8H6ARA3_9HELO|nr:putative transcription factor c2h2 protein [Botrytis fragariae]KAF5872498.1 putative transcription factor c2h2 protein [Botrytis fragariae]
MTFMCWTCEATFDTREQMFAHCINRRHQRAWVCVVCEELKAFGSQQAREMHTAAKHTFCCRDCNEAFDNQDDLASHNKSQHQLSCQFCERVFRTSTARTAHVDAVHPYHCYECRECFTDWGHFNAHELEYHNLKCLPCDKVFRTLQALEQHALSPAHPFQCQKCRRGYLFEATLKRHIADHHTWACDLCQEMCEGPKHLEMHKKLEHSNFKCSECEACHSPRQGTIDVPFSPFIENDISSNNLQYLQSITCHFSCWRLSFEELRLADYNQGFRYKKDGMPITCTNNHRIQCPKCPKCFENVLQLFQHAADHIILIEKYEPGSQINCDNEDSTCKLQLKCHNSGCHHQPSILNATRHHYHTFNVVKCGECDGFFNQGEDPQLQAHTAKMHTRRPLFGCVQCTQTFPTSDAAAAHYATEHAFICEACPGTFFINSATRERHFITCGNLSETSDSGESFQTSRTEFSPLMQRKTLPSNVKVPHSSATPLIQFHEEPLFPAQPLIQIYERSAIERINAAQELAQKILAEANACPQAMYTCKRCSPLVEI